MKKRIIAFLLAVITVFLACPMPLFSVAAIEDSALCVEESAENSNAQTEEGYITGMVDIVCDFAIGNRVVLKKGEKIYAETVLAEQLESDARYQWQMKISGGSFAVISDYVLPYALLTDALIANATLEDGVATLRCVVTSGDKRYVSSELKVVPSEATSLPLSLAFAEQKDEQKHLSAMPLSNKTEAVLPLSSSLDAFQIVVNYTYRHATAALDIDGKSAANTFTVTLPQGGYYTGTVATPPEVGYLPYVKYAQMDYVTKDSYSMEPITYAGEQYVLAHSIEFDNVTDHTVINVYYIPQEVEVCVKVYEQNLYNDEYVLVETKHYKRIANEAIGVGYDEKRSGFESVGYAEGEVISEDGSYALDIYYERNYYLVNYEAGEDAHGATPHFVRYNTQAMMPAPRLLGNTFLRWELISVKDEKQSDVAVHPYAATESAGALITVQHNLVYKASWELSSAYYTVVYWLENAESTDSQNKENYDVWYTHKIRSKTGNKTIAAADNIKQYVTAGNGFSQDQVSDVVSTYSYLTYQEGLSDTENKTLLGNGTTTVNIYYSRNSYTLKFYYAIEKTENKSSTYHLIGGSTYYFGGNATGSAQNNAVAAMRQYASGSYTGQTGQVTALPMLNEKGQQRNYTVSFDTDGAAKYHYLSFTAKFGADIRNLWPCDVFNSATRTKKNTHGNWSGTQAFVSAWNGEYRVRYTQDSSVNNGNQTIKGNYTQLDANLLWNNTSVKDTTVSYACFWENGADINWSVPELYRYNIYLPLLPGQETEGLTLRSYNGTTYYLFNQYDTCDDSSTSAQTQPGLVGFKPNGRQWETIALFDTSVYKEAYDMFFYYSRNIYHLTFNDQHGNSVTTTVPYDTFLGGHSEEDHTPAYPAALEVGECVFAGWFFDEGCQIPWGHDTRMPAKNIQLYAKWDTLSYNVSVYYYYDEKNPTQNFIALQQTVPFGTFVKEPDHRVFQKENPEYQDLIFTGWYYQDGGVVKRIDFNTMMIKKDTTIYAGWTSKTVVRYTVHYVTLIDGQYVKIAESLTGTARVGSTMTFTAEVGQKLNPGYQTGYFPEMRSHSMTMNGQGENEYSFVYTHASEITYTVTHTFVSDKFTGIIGASSFVEEFMHRIAGEEIVSTAASVGVSFREGITKEAIVRAAEKKKGETLSETEKATLWTIVTQMSPDYFEQNITLSTDSQNPNAAIFQWGYKENTGSFQIVHYEETLTGEYVVHHTENGQGNINADVKASVKLPNDGFELNAALSSDEGKIKGLEVNQDGTLSEGLVLRMYYSRKRYNYTVYHYEDATNKVLAPTSEGVALHGEKISVAEVCVPVDGYAVFNGTQTYEIINNDFEVICKYKGVDVYYRYQITGSNGASLSIYTADTVVGEKAEQAELTLARGYYLRRWYYTVGNGEETEVPQQWLSYDGDKIIVSPDVAPVEWAEKTVYIYAVVLPKTRRFVVSGASASPEAQMFIFRLKGKQNEVDVTFVISGNDYVDVAMLPYGDYTVTVLDWTWRYGLPMMTYGGETQAAQNGSFELTLGEDGDVNFIYSGTPNEKWLTDDISHSIPLS